MFKLTPITAGSLSVRIVAPDGSEGECTIDMPYRGVESHIEYLRHIAEAKPDDRAIVDENVIGWSGLLDHDGAPLDHADPAVRDRVLDVPYVYFAVRQALFKELFERGETKALPEKTDRGRPSLGGRRGFRLCTAPGARGHMVDLGPYLRPVADRAVGHPSRSRLAGGAGPPGDDRPDHRRRHPGLAADHGARGAAGVRSAAHTPRGTNAGHI